MSEQSDSRDKHVALVIEIPAIYTADLDELRQYGEHDTESDFLLNCIGQPSVVRLRVELSGEKDGKVQEVWGLVREAQLVEPSVGYVPGGTLTDEQLADNGTALMRDEDACEWCEYREPDDD